MEPGPEDREHQPAGIGNVATQLVPQWSPVLRTGSTPATVPPTRTWPYGRNGARS
jgi:hypothetical protein